MLAKVAAAAASPAGTWVLCKDCAPSASELVGRQAQVLRARAQPFLMTVVLDLTTEKRELARMFRDEFDPSWSAAGVLLRGGRKKLFNEGDWLTTDLVTEREDGRLKPTWQSEPETGRDGPLIRALGWDPAGKRLLTAGLAGRLVRVRDAESGKELACLEGHYGLVTVAAWDPDGTRIASVSSDGTVRMWDPATGEELWCAAGLPTNVYGAVAWRPDGRVIAVGGWVQQNKEKILLLETSTGRTIRWLIGYRQPITALAWSPDGSRLIGGDLAGMVRIWMADGKAVVGWRDGHDDILAMAWSPDGSGVLVGGEGDRIRLYDASEWNLLLSEAPVDSPVRAVAWRSDGEEFVSGHDDGSVRLRAVPTGTELRRFDSHDGGVGEVAWSPDGKWIASGGRDAIVRIRDAVTGKDRWPRAGHLAPVSVVAWSPDGKTLISGSSDGHLRGWGAARGLKEHWRSKHRRGLAALAFSPDGSRFVSVGGVGARIFRTVDGNPVRTLPPCRREHRSVAWSPDGKWLAAAGEHDLLTLELTRKGDKWHRDPETGYVEKTAWSPAGGRLAAITRGNLYLWQPPSGKLTSRLRIRELQDDMTALAWAPDGKRFVTTGHQGWVSLWDAAAVKIVRIFRGHTDQIGAVAWDTDGRWFATGGNDQALRVWNPETGDCLAAVRVRPGVAVTALAACGDRIAVGGTDGLVRVYVISSDGLKKGNLMPPYSAPGSGGNQR